MSNRGRKRTEADPAQGRIFHDLNQHGMALRDISVRYSTDYDAVRRHIKAYRANPDFDAPKTLKQPDVPRLYTADDVADGFNQLRVDRLIEFIRQLRIPATQAGRAASAPVISEEFLGKFIRNVYGRAMPDGNRMIRTALLSVARQNGKSLLAAMLALAQMIGPEAIPGTQIVCGATSRQQAGVVFSKVAGIAEASNLASRLKILRHGMKISVADNGVEFSAVPRESRTMQGYSLPFFVCDELAQHHDIDFFNALANSQGSFEEPLALVISTKATHPGNPMGRLLEYSKAVEDGQIDDPTWYAQIHSADPNDDWEDEAVWRKANPNMGVSPKIEDMRVAYRKAKIVTAERHHFQTYRLNMDASLSSRLFSVDAWRACADETISLDDLKGQVCYGGLDLAEVRDMSSFALYFPEQGIVNTWQWLPTGMIAELQEQSKIPFTQWAADGVIDVIGDQTQDYGELAEAIDSICKRFNVMAIGFDPYRIAQLEVAARERAIKLPPMLEVRQSMAHMPAMLEAFERVLYDGRLRHPNNAALNMAATTVEFVQDKTSGSRKPLKPVASNVRIDPIIAAIMAVGVASRSKRKTANRFAGISEAMAA